MAKCFTWWKDHVSSDGCKNDNTLFRALRIGRSDRLLSKSQAHWPDGIPGFPGFFGRYFSNDVNIAVLSNGAMPAAFQWTCSDPFDVPVIYPYRHEEITINTNALEKYAFT